MLSPSDFTSFLHEQIPLTRAMGIQLVSWDGTTVSLSAPLAPNQNHADTAFGGAISTLAILAGFSLLHLLFQDRNLSTRTLIQQSTTNFLRPIDADLLATASVPPPELLTEFLDTMKRKRRARLSLDSQVHCRKILSATHTGLFVALIY